MTSSQKDCWVRFYGNLKEFKHILNHHSSWFLQTSRAHQEGNEMDFLGSSTLPTSHFHIPEQSESLWNFQISVSSPESQDAKPQGMTASLRQAHQLQSRGTWLRGQLLKPDDLGWNPRRHWAGYLTSLRLFPSRQNGTIMVPISWSCWKDEMRGVVGRMKCKRAHKALVNNSDFNMKGQANWTRILWLLVFPLLHH